ncbi:hypothetical protein EV126DRAFT_433509 [Verticillium dahliae]|nr:hypothetical protein EV126DRAFT_433509 [Verticillium dahliae]
MQLYSHSTMDCRQAGYLAAWLLLFHFLRNCCLEKLECQLLSTIVETKREVLGSDGELGLPEPFCIGNKDQRVSQRVYMEYF